MSELSPLPAVQTAAYLPNGRRLYFSVPATSIADLLTKALELDAALTAAGLSVREPGLNEGEQRESIAYVVRRAKLNDDGTETPVIDLYPEKLSYKFLTIYLNTKDDENAFERATGLKLQEIPYCNFKAAIERGKDGKDDLNYVRALPAATGLIWKNNPRWEGENDKKHPKRVFVRWADLAPNVVQFPSTTPSPAENGSSALQSQENGHSGNLLTIDPKLVNLREWVHTNISKDLTDVQIAAYAGIKAFSNLTEWREKHGTLDKARAAIKAAYDFEQLPSMVQTVEF